MNKPKGKIKIAWSPEFAYAIGLIVSDGNLSPDGRHISFTTKDLELALNFLTALNIPNNHIGKKSRGGGESKKYFVIQFGDVLFYRFLLSIGLMPKKSLLLQKLIIPDEYFSHFTRGLFDGDGSFNSYWDPRWKSSFMYYTSFASASPIFLRWFQEKLVSLYKVHGAITGSRNQNVEKLAFAKKESKILVPIMYQSSNNLYLTRKHLKIFKAFSILSPPTQKRASGETVDSLL